MTNRKNDVKFHEVLKQASIYVYGKKTLPTGYRVIDKAENRKNGFYAEAISNGKDVIIIYRGSEDRHDFQNDIDMAHSQLPSQCIDAMRFHDKVVRENQNCDVTVTGHSLGGSNAEIVSGVRGTTAVTFNAYGVKDMFTSYTKLKKDNIVNYVNEMDFVTMVNGENHIGEIYSVPNVAKESNNPFSYKKHCHDVEGMGKLSERVPKTPAEIKEKAERLHPNSLRIKNKINKNSNNSNRSSQCVGSYSVSGYTRSDGKEVSSYTRTCGAKHSN